MAGRKFDGEIIMFPINRQTQIKTWELPAVTECDTRFRNNAKFASFGVLFSQREWRSGPEEIIDSLLHGGRPCIASCRKESPVSTPWLVPGSRTFRQLRPIVRTNDLIGQSAYTDLLFWSNRSRHASRKKINLNTMSKSVYCLKID